ncbi:MAG: choice-of-anchor J domain-containing protein [Bacteroidales bacterium]|nr:choice-of-anchor J domain-containing protein [Bacteroidales bacterium]
MRKFLTTLLLLVFLAPFAMHADEVIIGTGTEEDAAVPFNTSYSYSWNETIYPGSEIGDACTINAVSFHGNAAGTLTLREVDIYMGVTQRDVMSTLLDWTPAADLTLVYSGENVVIGDTAWETFTLDVPFYYSGNGNLVVVVAKKLDGYNGQLKWYYTKSAETENTVMFRRNDSSESIADEFPNGHQANGRLSYRANIKLDITYGELESPLSVNPSSLDLGYRPIGAWMAPMEVSLTTEEPLTISSISSSNSFFTLNQVEMPYELTPENPLTLKVSHFSGNDGQQNGEIVINHSFGSDVVTVTANAYTPSISDVWEMPRVIDSYPFVDSPEYSSLYNNYNLPGDEQDGSDIVYRLSFQEETTFSASVSGANGKIALYATHFNGQGGPGANNYYGAEPEDDDDDNNNGEYQEPLGDSFFFDFDDGTLNGWRTIDADGDYYNWRSSIDVGVWGYNDTECICSESYSTTANSALYPDNYIVTQGCYTITENSALSFHAIPLDTYYSDEHYGVAVSADGVNFTTIWEHTVQYNEVAEWQYKTVDLSAYAGRNMYIALRHFDCTNEYAICIDNVQLTPGRGTRGNKIQNLTVPAGIYYLVASATEQFSVSINTSNGGYNTVAEVVAQEVGNNANVTWSWYFLSKQIALASGKEIKNAEDKEIPEISCFKVYREEITPGEEIAEDLLAENITDTTYVDATWASVTQGVYRYGVSVVYTDSNETPVVWSNNLDKNMNTTVTVNVDASNGASVAGAQVTFSNLSETSYVYNVTLDASGSYTWNDFRVGTYEYTIAMEGFESCATNEIIRINEPTVIECTLEEQFQLGDFYVSPTGWAMWDNNGASYTVMLDGQTVAEVTTPYYQFDVTSLVQGQDYTAKVVGATTMEYTWTYNACDNYADAKDFEAVVNGKNVELSWVLPIGAYSKEFMFDFENGTLDGFVTIDANEDGATWMNSKQYSSADCGYESQYSAISCSYYNFYDIEPNDYLVTAKKYSITGSSKLIFRVCAENQMYAAEHYGVAISTNSNYDEADFTTIWEETLTAKAGAKVGRNDRAQGTYYEKVIDLSAYAGQDVYIAIRHFGCFGQFFINIDNLTLTTSATRGDGEWLHYDNESNYDAIGLQNGGSFYWGIMFPAATMADYADNSLTKVSMYDKNAHTGKFFIYAGGDTAPSTLLHTQDYECVGSNDYREFELTSPIQITGTQNIWIVFKNETGQFVASCCSGTGDPNSRWISMDGSEWLDVNNATGYDFSWQIRAYVEESTEPNYSEYEVLGAMIYRDGELITSAPIDAESYTDVTPGYGDFEYSVRVVYGGERESYYAMSCPLTDEVTVVRVCDAPKNLHGEEGINENGESGVSLIWPYTMHGSEWLYYDDSSTPTGLGLGGDSFYWGIMFPVEALEFYGGTYLTKVAMYDKEGHDGNINIYYGGDNAPEILVHSQPYVCTGINDFVEFDLTAPLPIDPTMNLWVTFNNNNGSYPAAGCVSTGDPNGRWISFDGSYWVDVATQALNYTWMIRAFVTSELKGTMELDSREEVFEHYNVYRSTSNDNYEVVAETKLGNYFDVVESGTYYYQVTSVFTIDGEECESAPANSYDNPEDNYVVVEVVSIDENGVNGMMVYPNPTNGSLNITADDMNSIAIINTLGQVVYEIAADSDSALIDMTQFEAGVYMVRIVTDNGVAVERITVVK